MQENVTQAEQRESSSIKVRPSLWRGAKKSALDYDIKLYELVEQSVECYQAFRDTLNATGANYEKACAAMVKVYKKGIEAERAAKEKDSKARSGDKSSNSGEAGNLGNS